ncbi:dienelactone hydrolase family protein [Alteromonas sp. CYL-A6]|uniref:dienelactone hydrolase family protein n=1 Tax=Alteromonas nitratireducens TaxID=3390813 RepID=UPI0034B14B75
MCDEQSERDISQRAGKGFSPERRDFNKLLAIGSLAAAFPQFTVASDHVVSHDVSITTPDGSADGYFVHPKQGNHPAVLMWPDIKGLRPAFKQMATRLAAQGYAVLVVNPFYRDVSGAALPDSVTFPSNEAWAILREYRSKLTSEAVVRDAQAFFAFMDAQDAVNTQAGGGAMGYCMSGSFVMRAAAAMPERLSAIASFHGGGLATDDDDSPHLTVPHSRAAVLHAIAENDDEKVPQMKVMLRDAYAQADLPATVEVYEGTLHGWCPPDSRAYNETQAERAWSAALSLFKTHLV